MSSFSESALEKKLSELSNSQQSVQTLSLWIIHHRKHSSSIVNVWHREMKKVKATRLVQEREKDPPNKYKLHSMLHAYCVCIHCNIWNTKTIIFSHHVFKVQYILVEALALLLRVRSHVVLEFIKMSIKDIDFEGHPTTHCAVVLHQSLNQLHIVFGLVIAQGAPNHCDKAVPSRFLLTKNSLWPVPPVVVRLGVPAVPKAKIAGKLAVEEKKAIKRAYQKIQEAEEEEEEEEDDDYRGHYSPRDNDTTAPLLTEELIKALQDLENAASGDAAVRQKIASLPQEVQDVSLLEKITDKEAADQLSKTVDEACLLLAEYNGRLAAELEDRRQLSRMLTEYIQNEKEVLADREKKLDEYKQKLARVTQVRKELKSHIQSLPDLSLLPNVTGGLAPLPSAGDLFN
ncbi:RPR1B protein, partial [Polyodon spathula]|nr:RPR1B protein [Polyodon spathula]